MGCVTDLALPVHDVAVWPDVCLLVFNDSITSTTMPESYPARGRTGTPVYITLYQTADNSGKGCVFELAVWASQPCDSGRYGPSCVQPDSVPVAPVTLQPGSTLAALTFEGPYDPDVRWPNVSWVDLELVGSSTSGGGAVTVVVCLRNYDFPFNSSVADHCDTVLVPANAVVPFRAQVLSRPRMFYVVQPAHYIPLFVSVAVEDDVAGTNVSVRVTGMGETECALALAFCPVTMAAFAFDEVHDVTFSEQIPFQVFKPAAFTDELMANSFELKVTAIYGAVRVYLRYGATPNVTAGDWDMATGTIHQGGTLHYFVGEYARQDLSDWFIVIVPDLDDGATDLPMADRLCHVYLTSTNVATTRPAYSTPALTGSEIAGIVIGSIAAVALLASAAIYWNRRRLETSYESIQ